MSNDEDEMTTTDVRGHRRPRSLRGRCSGMACATPACLHVTPSTYGTLVTWLAPRFVAVVLSDVIKSVAFEM